MLLYGYMRVCARMCVCELVIAADARMDTDRESCVVVIESINETYQWAMVDCAASHFDCLHELHKTTKSLFESDLTGSTDTAQHHTLPFSKCYCDVHIYVLFAKKMV